jgi:hypothetical protein
MVSGMLVRCGFSGRRGDVCRVKDEERQFGRQSGNRYVEELAIAKGPFPDGLLRTVRDSLDNLGSPPLGKPGEPVGRCPGSHERRNVSVDAALSDTFPYQQIPDLAADRLLGLINAFAHR